VLCSRRPTQAAYWSHKGIKFCPPATTLSFERRSAIGVTPCHPGAREPPQSGRSRSAARNCSRGAVAGRSPSEAEKSFLSALEQRAPSEGPAVSAKQSVETAHHREKHGEWGG